MRQTTIRRLVALLAVAACAVFAATAAAEDGVTGKIIADVSKDGKVDGNYTAAQLRTALASPLLQQYGGTGGESGVESALGGTAGTGSDSDLPFTGADALLFAVVGGGLVAAGITLRRYGRNDAS